MADSLTLPPGMDAFGHIRNVLLRDFLELYLARRDGAHVARRSAFGPLDFPRLLPNIFFYDFNPEANEFRLRVAGEGIKQLLPEARAGMGLEEIFPKSALPLVQERYERICRQPAVMHNIGPVFQLAGGAGLGERVALPLADDHGQVRYMIGATVYGLDATPNGQFDEKKQTVTFTPL